MASRRMIDPSFWRSKSMAQLSKGQRLLFLGLISNADDQGRLRGHLALIRSDIFPFDDVALDKIESDLEAITAIGSILLYWIDGKQYIQVSNWWKYQHLRWARPSQMPAPEGWTDRWCYWNGKKTVFKNWAHGDRPNWWKKLRYRILRRDKRICQYCSAPAEHIDHIIPRRRGGSDDEDNLVAACARCNLSKGAKTPQEAGMELRNAQMA